MKYFLLTLIIGLCGFNAHAQRSCTTNEYWQNQLKADPALQLRYLQIQSSNAVKPVGSKKTQGPGVTDAPVITIPVVVHVLYQTSQQNISDEQIQSQLNVLNNDFNKRNKDIALVPSVFSPFAADCGIRFELATTDPRGKPTTGIIRTPTNRTSWKQDDQMKFTASGGSDAWNSRSYLNIWVCNLSNSILGYSTFPGAAPEKDGVVIRTDVFGISRNNNTPYNLGRTTTHEVGHWLNLKHLWGDADCGNDGVADTPPQKTFNSGCPSFPQVNVTGCNPDPSGDMFMNFMDFTDDVCLHMFTNGQKERIRQLFAASGARESLLYSDGLRIQQPDDPSSATTGEGTRRLSVVPNPAAVAITLQIENQLLSSGYSYTIYDVNGRTITSGRYSGNAISVKALQQGIYFIHLRRDEQTMVTKFLKQ